MIRFADRPGRPRLEEDESQIINAITNITMFGNQTDERRSATYLRLLPRDSRTNEGKRHVKTATVKLVRATTYLHKSHVDQHFCTATIRYLESLASMFGPNQVFFISQDDKARVPIGMTAAHKQSPTIMNMAYGIRLPDHDCAIAERHKLIPSAYAAMQIEKKEEWIDLMLLLTVALHILQSDLENTRCLLQKPTIPTSIVFYNFQSSQILSQNQWLYFQSMEALVKILATNTPGRSAFNRVERRMAPLSLPLSSLVLPHDTFGNLLDASRKTTSSDLELKNFT
ncbi:hypothetical protein EVAR_64211_1 [Eumeta japonica]|uniref:Uncharacterized protein n=1 Tax=Eumeta variegata TaxID=151549 RepID=A0A4C1Z2P9_EUMVA|nr:hypothetical protein EVAR_64211_1 [Eumeta japonica]